MEIKAKGVSAILVATEDKKIAVFRDQELVEEFETREKVRRVSRYKKYEIKHFLFKNKTFIWGKYGGHYMTQGALFQSPNYGIAHNSRVKNYSQKVVQPNTFLYVTTYS